MAVTPPEHTFKASRLGDGVIPHVRSTKEDYDKARAIPAAEFPGERNMYLTNLACVLGGYAPALCDEVERLRDALSAVYDLLDPLDNDREFHACVMAESALGINQPNVASEMEAPSAH